MFHIFKNDIFTERVSASTPFHPLVSYLQKLRFHREGYRLHPFSSSCFISSKTAFSPRGLPAPPLFIFLFHIFKNDIFTERVTGSTPFHPLVSYLQERRFFREGYRLHPSSSSCFISSKATFSPRGLPAPPLFILLFHIFKNGIFTELPAPPLFILLFHIFKNDVFTERVTGSTPFHVLVSYLQKRRFHREGYRLHPFSSSCFISSKTTFSPRGLPAPPLFTLLFHIFKNDIFTERVTGSTPFHPLVSYLQKQHFHREGYRVHPFSSSCFISSQTTFSPRGLPAPPLFILLLHIFENDIFTERVTGSTPFHPLVSYLQKRRFHQQGYRLHPFSPSCFISSKNDIFMEMVTGSTPFHPLVSYLHKRHFHRQSYRLHPFSSSCFNLQRRHFHLKGYRLHPFSSSCFISSKTAFHRECYGLHPFSSSCFISSKTACSPRGLPAPPLFVLLIHIFKNGLSTERVTGSTPLHPLVSFLQLDAGYPESPK